MSAVEHFSKFLSGSNHVPLFIKATTASRALKEYNLVRSSEAPEPQSTLLPYPIYLLPHIGSDVHIADV